MHHSATPSGLLSMMLSTMLSRLLCRLLSTLVMKGKERKGKEREGERLAPPGISIFVQQALQPASCIFKGGHAPRSPCVRLNRFLPGYGIQS